MSNQRRWTFSIKDFDDRESFLDADGKEIDYLDAEDATFVGTDMEALVESGRRADAWELRASACAARVTYHSRGSA